MVLGSKKSFTLTEILVGAVLISLAATASWIGVTVLMHSAEASHNQSISINLLQKSQEEVRRASQAAFDSLENCTFPAPDDPDPGICGFENLTGPFLEFTRHLSVSPVAGSTELKRVEITVIWTELGSARQERSVLLLSRPPAPLPGNIAGVVRPLGEANSLIEGAVITVTPQDSTASWSTATAGVLDSSGNNFDFSDSETGRFVLPAGSWNLTAAQSPGYYPYTHPVPIVIESNQEIFVEIFMEPTPEDAFIHGNVVHQATGFNLPTFNRGKINLFAGGALAQGVDDQRSYGFTVNFADTDPQCLTLNTNDAFKVGYAHFVGSAGAPSCTYLYNREGWSSAVIQDHGELICTHPWNGSSDSDRICVSPGEDVLRDIPVEPVPEVRISGRVVDSHGNPVRGATIRARWPRSDPADWRKDGVLQTVSSGQDGRFFNFSVPAVQGLFANANPNQNYLEVWAQGTVSVRTCCEQTSPQTRSSQRQFIGPLFPGDPVRTITQDFVISAVDQKCGNATGVISDDLNGSRIPGAAVRVFNLNENTNNNGQYQFVCAQEGYRLRTGSSAFQVTKNNYYFYHSQGTEQYQPAAGIVILENEVTVYDARLWPIGYGAIVFRVLDQASGSPLEGMEVNVMLYTGSSDTKMTNASGEAVFSNVIETWPPAALPPNDPYYRYGPKQHQVSVQDPDVMYLPVRQSIQSLNSGETRNVTIYLTTQGGA